MQKTAYDMLISDWSADLFSSDLHPQCSACPCTWRSTAQTPHRAFIAATHRGTAPAQALTSAGSIGCSRQAGPPALYQHASPKTGTGIQGRATERLLWTLGSSPRVTTGVGGEAPLEPEHVVEGEGLQIGRAHV